MWVSTNEAASMLGIRPNTIRQAIVRKSTRYVYREVMGRGGRGVVYEIWIGEAQESQSATTDPPARIDATQKRAHTELPTLELPHGRPSMEDKARLIVFYEQMTRGGMRANAFFRMINAGYTLSLSERTFYRWKESFAHTGAKGLAEKRGGNNIRIDKEVLKEIALAFGDRHMTNLYDAYKIRVAQKEGRTIESWVEESHVTYGGFVKAYKHMLAHDQHVRIALKGADHLLSQYPSARRRRMERNEEWQIDASPYDFMVMGLVQRWDAQKQELIEERRPVRATAIQIIDKGTGRRVWGLYESPNSYANVRVLKKALLKFGKPKVLKGDNGADYISKHFQNTLYELGIVYIKSRKYKGSDKGAVERSFGTVMHGRLELLAGFIGHNVTQRERIENRAFTKAEQISGKATHLEHLMTWEEMEATLDVHLEMEERRLGWLAKWEQSDAEIVRIPEWEINHAIGRRKRAKFHRTGVVYNGIDYLNLDLAVQGWIGRTVEVAENIDDIRHVHLFDEAGVYIGSATNTHLQNFTVEQMRTAEKTATKELRILRTSVKRVEKEVGEAISGIYASKVSEKLQERKESVMMKQTKEATQIAAVNVQRKALEELLEERYKDELTGT